MLFIVLFGLHLLCHGCVDAEQYNIAPNKIQEIIIPTNGVTSVTSEGFLNASARFTLIQLHSQWKNISISSSKDFTFDTSKNGTNVGLVTMLEKGQNQSVWYVMTLCDCNVTVTAIVQVYTADDPIPGGCNQVFDLEFDPSIALDYSHAYMVGIQFQWANLARPFGQPLPDCEASEVADNLAYEVYVTFMEQHNYNEADFFKAVQQNQYVHDIYHNGIEIFSVMDSPTSKSQVSVSSRRGQGVVYTVVVTRKDTGRSASYTTTASYSCDNFEGSCPEEDMALKIVGMIVFIVVGIFILLFGHSYFSAAQVMFGFIFCCLLTYILLMLAQLQGWVPLFLAVVAGSIGGALWLLMWRQFRFPTAQVFLMGLCAGYVLSAVLFFSPFGNLKWWIPPVNYALGYTCISLLFAVLFMNYSKCLSILSCSVLGSTLLMWAIAVPLWGSLEMVILNAIYHQTQSGYTDIKVFYPVNTRDIVLYVLWPVLACGGMAFQFYWSSNKPSLSSPFRTMRSNLLSQNVLPQQSSTLYTGDDDDEEEAYNVSYDDRRRNTAPGTGSSETSRLLVPQDTDSDGMSSSTSYRNLQTQRSPPVTQYVGLYGSQSDVTFNKII